MMRSLFSGVSGLKSHQTRMDTIGNNIANVNTTGFKSSRTTFADTLSQTLTGASAPSDNLGGTNPKQIGLGTGVASIDTIFTDGSVQSTGKNTDLCLSGNGLFVVSKGGQTYYTRDGAFEFDANGNYVLPSSGLFVQGWTATNGVLNTSGAAGNITIPSGKSMASKATATATYSNNLNSAALTIKKISGGSDLVTKSKSYSAASDGSVQATTSLPVTLTLADGKTIEVTSGTYTVGGTYNNSTTKDSTFTSATKSANNSLILTLEDGSTIKDTDLVNGTYTVGDLYTRMLTASGDQATKSSSNTITLTLVDGTTVADGSLVSGTTYTVGSNYSKTLSASGDSVTKSSNNTVTLTLADGTTVADGSLTTGNVYAVGSTYSKSYTAAGDTVKKLANNTVTLTLKDGSTVADTDLTTGTTYRVGNSYSKTLSTTGASATASANNTVTLTLSDGTTVTGTNGSTYNVGATYSGTLTISSIKVSSDITSMQADSNISSIKDDINIKSIENDSKIKGLDYSALVSSMSAPYIESSKASSTLPVTLTMSDGTTVTETTGSYTLENSLPVTTTINVYDTLGNKHAIPVYFTKTSTDSTNGNTWTVSIGTSNLTTGTSQNATITESDGSTTTVSMANTALQFNTSGKYTSGSGNQATLTLTNGANGTQTVTLDLSALTQYSGTSTVNGATDGNAAGTLSSVSIDSTGTVTGTYSNGVKQAEALVAVAQFNNASGLTKTGNSLYQESNNSGTANVKTASDLGVSITPSALEMSNVDIANEFSDMIITQRGFQSNSKIITVGDEMLETLIGMKR
jgi:flagellar hook protein FlgE